MALVNPNIAMSYRGVEIPQQNALADYAAIQQIQGGQRQAEVAQMQLEKMRREESGLDQMMATITAKGGPSDPMVAADAMIKSKIPQYMEMGFKLQNAARQRTEDMAAMGLSPTAAPAAAPASEAYPGYNEAIGMPAPTNALAPVASEPYPGYNESIGMTNALAPAAAPVNAMTPSADKDAQIRQAKLKMLSPTVGVREAGKLELEKLLAPPPFRSVAAGASVLGPDNKVIFTAPAAPAAPTTLSRLQTELAALPPGDPRRADYIALIRKETTHAPGTKVILPEQEKAFEGELGKGQAKSIIDSRTAAQDAVSIIDTVETGRGLLKSGMITGAGADFMVNLNQALKTAGVDFGYADAAANSQAYAANMAQNVGKIIKQFGAGTGLSDADRQYAEKMAAGKITLDTKALNKILDINERGARNVIARHNKDVEGIKTVIPLKVEAPAKRAEPAAVVTAPSAAIEYLRANPSMKNAFDAKYGAGAADRALRGQ